MGRQALPGVEPVRGLAPIQSLWSLTRAPRGESLLEVQARAWKSLEDIQARHQDETVAAITHGDVIRSLLLLLLGMPLDHILRLEVGPASVSEIALGGGDPLVRSVNQIFFDSDQRQ